MSEVRPTEPLQYRREGELESSLDIKKLPPTPITQEAEETLVSWGFTENIINELRQLTASFRYDLPLEKMTRLTESDVFVLRRNQVLQVELPNYYDLKGRFDGQCGDLARQFVLQAEFSGFLADVNEALKLPDGMRVVSGFSVGQSRTHFSLPGTTHVWNSLSVVDKDGDLIDSILVDAAFQTIETYQQSGYHPVNAVHGITNLNNFGLEASARLGRVNIDPQLGAIDISDGIILGISSSRKYAYGLAFAARVYDQILTHADVYSTSPENIVPIIRQINANSEGELFFIDPDTGLTTSTVPLQSVEFRELAEIQDMLDLAQRFKYNFNPAEYPRLENHKYSVSFKS